MQLGDKSDETGQLAAELAGLTGEPMNVAVSRALRERLARVRRYRDRRPAIDELDEIALRCAALPILDTRMDDEILGYDDHELPDRW